MELAVMAIAAGAAAAWAWRRRITPEQAGPADPYTVWMLRFIDRHAYRSL